MMKYTPENYRYDIMPEDKHKDWLANTLLVGAISNTDDESFVLPILVRKESIGTSPSQLPNLSYKSTLGIFSDEDYEFCPSVIFMDHIDYLNLTNGDSDTEVALYHEIGHFHYSDELDPMHDMAFRLNEIKNGRLMKEEKQADDFACDIVGKTRMLNALKSIYNLAKQFGFKEQETEALMRILAISKK